MTFNLPQAWLQPQITSDPMKGTKHTHTYTPMGNKTKVLVGGEFLAQGMDDATLKKAALTMFKQVFGEDAADLRNFQ